MLIPVLIISSLVHIYSISYMSNDPRCRVKGIGFSLAYSLEVMMLYFEPLTYVVIYFLFQQIFPILHILEYLCILFWLRVQIFVDLIISGLGSSLSPRTKREPHKSCFAPKGKENSILRSNMKIPMLLNRRQHHYSRLSTFSEEDFLPWLCGFTDAEGCFYIISNTTEGRLSWYWAFEIGLHIDDKQVLEYIQSYLQIGNVYLSGKKATFRVRRKEDIKKIIDVFSKTPLQSMKQLNFQDWKLAFETYYSTDSKDQALFEKIMSIKLRMNSKRDNYDWPGRKPQITSAWLLGFVEGDGSFLVLRSKPKKLYFRFVITQSHLDLALLEAIKRFLNDLTVTNILSSLSAGGQDFAYLNEYIDKRERSNNRKVYHLIVNHSLFISEILIPLFDGFTFRSNKRLDYDKWKTIFKLKEKGHHLHSEGLEVIEWLISMMNSRRLSTNSKSLRAEKYINMSAQETKRLEKKLDDLL